MMKKGGRSVNQHQEENREKLKEQKPLVQAYVIDQVRDKMISNEAAIGVIYSGEAIYTQSENPDLEYVIPKEGSNLWIDSWFIPKTCQNEEAAKLFIDYLCGHDAGMANFEYVYYASPITPVVEALDEDVRNNEAIIPSKESLKRCEIFTSLDNDKTALLNHLWQELKSRTVN